MKYKIGDKVGPKNIEILQFTKTTSYGHRYCLFKCPECGSSFESKLYHVTSGSIVRCKKCSIERRKGVNSINFKDLTNQRFGKLIAKKYIGNKIVGYGKNNKTLIRSLWLCQCDCGNFIEKTTNELTRGNVSSCPKCNLKSKGEYLIKTVLEELKIQYECQKRFIDCKDKQMLPFDFYLPEYNCCIEYDGTTHYIPNKYGSWNTQENIELTQKHDKIKNEYCKKKKINLIRISYKEINKINPSFIKQLLCDICN